jgi:hypothetical protein
MPIIPATQEAEVGGLWLKASPRQKHEMRPYLKNKLKAKRLELWLKCGAPQAMDGYKFP